MNVSYRFHSGVIYTFWIYITSISSDESAYTVNERLQTHMVLLCVVMSEGTTIHHSCLQRHSSALATYLTSSEVEAFADYTLIGKQERLVGEEVYKTSPTSVPYSSL
jgi:hypothetical protein